MLRAALFIALAAGPAAAAPRLDAYVTGRFALETNDLGQASARFGDALAGDPGSPLLQRRAFEIALAAGDIGRAARLAPALAAADPKNAPVALFEMARAFEGKRWDTADAAIARLEGGQLGAAAGPILSAWVLVGRGRADDALALLKPQLTSEAIGNLRLEHRARVLAAAGRWPEAAAVFAEVLAKGPASAALRLTAADAAERAGDRAGAARLLGGDDYDSSLEAARARLAAGGRVLEQTGGALEGAAALLARFAGDLGGGGRGASAALPFARLAVLLAPGRFEHPLLLAGVLARSGQSRAALGVLDAARPGEDHAAAARGLRAALLADQGRAADALGLLAAAAARPEAGVADHVRHGDLLREQSRHAEAAAAYSRAVALGGDGPRAWTLYFLRGGAYEQAGDWERAEPDLRAALARAPNEAIVLNYLGYALLDRGQMLDEAEVLVRRAVALAPDSAAIIDSLGWFYFRTGRFPEAVAELERAVAGAPGDPEINEHLGDAYWRVGRTIEARHRWRAAATAEPKPEIAARLAAKLDFGLDRMALAGASTPR